MKYTLIQTYPGYETLGETHSYGEGFSKEWLGTKFYESHPKYWQKVEEDSTGGGLFGSFVPLLNLCISIKKQKKVEELDYEILKMDCVKNIHSVKTLSDGEVFTIGDKIKYGGIAVKISSFETERNIIWVKNKNGGACILSSVTKSKTPLFTTEDGVDVFQRDSYFLVSNDYKIAYCSFFSKSDLEFKLFYSKEKAEEYITLNKPILSINDIVNNSIVNWFGRESLIELAKSKL